MHIVDERNAVYSALFHHTDTFNVAFPHITIADKLQRLENFDRIDPLSHKCGVMLAKCTCNDSYRNFVSNRWCSVCSTAQVSLVVPSTDHSKQLKEKTKVQVNPFNASEIRKKKLAKDKGVVPEQPTWASNIPKAKGMMHASAASIMRPASLKDKKETQLTDDAEGDDAEGDVGGAVLDPELPTKEGNSAANDVSQFSRKRKAALVRKFPDIPRKQIKV
jgi:hypothetical protein